MDEKLFLATAGISLLSFGLISRKLDYLGITPPLAFVIFGIVVSILGRDWIANMQNLTMIQIMAELALILILFTDATYIHLDGLLKNTLPLRLLLIAFPLTILLGVFVAKEMFSLSYLDAAFLAILLAPTDLALGKAVISSPLIPKKIKEALHTESGLNDGLALPFLLAAISISLLPNQPHSLEKWIGLTVLEIVIGIFVGVLIGQVSGILIEKATKKQAMLPVYQRLTVIGLALFSFGMAQLVYGNGFIATFCAGAFLRIHSPLVRKKLVSFGEAEGEQLALFIFYIFGALFLPRVWNLWDIKTFIYAILSLTAIRMIPVFISLLWSKTKWPSIFFMGFFGPRGIATILFSITIFQNAKLSQENVVLSVTFATVFLSILIHGLTARPLARLHYKMLAR